MEVFVSSTVNNRLIHLYDLSALFCTKSAYDCHFVLDRGYSNIMFYLFIYFFTIYCTDFNVGNINSALLLSGSYSSHGIARKDLTIPSHLVYEKLCKTTKNTLWLDLFKILPQCNGNVKAIIVF